MLIEEVEQCFVANLIVFADILVGEITTKVRLVTNCGMFLREPIIPSTHETVHLVIKPFDQVLLLHLLLPRGNVVLALILAGQHRNRHSSAFRVVWIHHGRMSRRTNLEGSTGLSRERHDLAAPAESENAPLLNRLVLGHLLEQLQGLGDALDGLRWRPRSLEKLAQLFALLLRVWRVPRDVGRFALEPVGHEDFVFLAEDIGALEGLREEPEDVVDEEDGFLGLRLARHVRLHAVDFGPGAFGRRRIVRSNRWDGTARGAMAVHAS